MGNMLGAALEAPHMVTAGTLVVAGGPNWRFPKYIKEEKKFTDTKQVFLKKQKKQKTTKDVWNTNSPSCVLPRAAMAEGAEFAGVLLKRSGADDPSDWLEAANSSAPNRSLDVD